ncbi:MAG: hypothetical protein HC774_06815 [Sphingomonadales bacterium]|nr:hypothetical protein [Sphingomonadales bacterium]
MRIGRASRKATTEKGKAVVTSRGINLHALPEELAMYTVYAVERYGLVFWIERLIPGGGRQAFVNPEHKQELV